MAIKIQRAPILDPAPHGLVRKISREEAKRQFPTPPKRAGRKPKVLFTLRLEQDVLEAWRATGPGYQARMNEALRKEIR